MQTTVPKPNQTSAQTIDDFFADYPLRSYDKGQILVFAEETPSSIFYLKSGRVRKYDIAYQGSEVVVNVFENPAIFPMSWVINRTANKYFYKTEMLTELSIVPVEAVLTFIEANPSVMMNLLSQAYEGMEDQMGRAVHLMSGSAKSRLVYELIIECDRIKETSYDDSYAITTNENDIAARSGLSRETVSRELRKLKDTGLVEVTGKGMLVKQLRGLRELSAITN